MSRTRSCLVVLALAGVLHIGGGKVYADILYYVGPDHGSWHTPANWSLGRVPRSGDDVRIFDDLTVRITADVAELNGLTVAYARNGTVIQESGQTSTRYLTIGRSDTYVGSYVLNGGYMFVDGDFYVGRSGVFTQNGGILDLTTTVNLESWVTGSAVYNLDGGMLRFFGAAATATPFKFDPLGDPYFDFDGGSLFLKGDWTFDRLLSISNSHFRAFGKPAAADNLVFDLTLIGTDVYTEIFAIPEPSMLALLGTAVLGLLAYVCRRRRCR